MQSKLVVEPVAVEVAGETVAITPFKFGQLPAVARHLQRIASLMNAGTVDVPTLIAEGGEDVLALAALAAGKPREWMDTITMDEGIALVAAVVQANREVLEKKLPAALARLTNAISA